MFILQVNFVCLLTVANILKPKDIFSSAVVELLHLEAYQFLLKHVPTFYTKGCSCKKGCLTNKCSCRRSRGDGQTGYCRPGCKCINCENVQHPYVPHISPDENPQNACNMCNVQLLFCIQMYQSNDC
jgi:hypothetical protein